MPEKLHFYTQYSKEKIKIAAKPLASGGEGAIYPVISPRAYKHLVVKVYYPEKRTDERERKMNYLIQHPPTQLQEKEDPSIGWVKDLVYNEQRFIGILLLKLEGKKLTKLTLSKLPRRADEAWKRFAFGKKDALKLRLHACFNLAVIIQKIHETKRYVLIDLKPDNVLMQPNGLMAVVDMDSVQVIENGKAIFSAPVATPEYTPPEHYQDKNLAFIEETWDRFSFGVIFYQLLFGLHPFAASCNAPYDDLVSLNDKIKHGLYVHHPEKKHLFKVIPPPHQRFYDAPKELQAFFQTCFVNGNSNPSLRPTALDWCIMLSELLNLPSSRFSRLKIEPSDLYFLPEILFRLDPLIQQLPSYSSDILLEEALHKLALPQSPISNSMDEAFLKEEYAKNLSINRGFLWVFFLIIFSLAIFSILILPQGLILAIIMLIIWFQHFFIWNSQDVIPFLSNKFIIPSVYQALGLKHPPNEEQSIDSIASLVNERLNARGEYLTQQVKKIAITQQKISSSDTQLLEQYVKKRTALDKEINQLKEDFAKAKTKIEAARTNELTIYRNAANKFDKRLQEAPFKRYNKNSYAPLKEQIEQEIKQQELALKTLTNQINLQKKLDQINNSNKQLKTQIIEKLEEKWQSEYSKMEKKLRSKKERQLIDFQDRTNIQQQDILKKLEEKEYFFAPRGSFQLYSSYQTFLSQEKAIKKEFYENKKKYRAAAVAFLQRLQEQFQLTKKQFDLYLKAPFSSPHLKHISLLKQDVEKALLQIREQLLKNSSLPSVSSILDLLQQKLPTPKLLSSSEKKSFNLNRLKKINNKRKEHQMNLYKALEVLKIKTNSVQNEALSDNLTQEIARAIKQVYLRIETCNISYEECCTDRIFYELDQYFPTYQKKRDQATLQIEKDNAKHKQELATLRKTYKDAILYNKNSSLFDKRKKEEFKASIQKEKNRIEELKNIATKAYKRDLEKELTAELKQLKLKQSTQINETVITEQLTKKKAELVHVVQSELNALPPFDMSQTEQELEEEIIQHKMALDNLEKNYKKLIQDMSLTRSQAEETYTTQKALLNKQHKTLLLSIEKIEQEYPQIRWLLKQHQQLVHKLANEKASYKSYQELFKELNDEKIKLDSFIQFKNNYSSKIYIKDLLLNKVEQFDKNK